MKIKIKRLLISLLTTILMFNLLVMSGCQLIYLIQKIGQNPSSEGEETSIVISGAISEEEKKVLDEVITEAEKEIEEAELEEEEKMLPNEPVKYNGEFGGVSIILVIDFKTTKVTGSVSLSGDDYVDANIKGKIDIETFEVSTDFSGIMGSKEYGKAYPFNGTINGVVTDNLGAFIGDIVDDEGTGGEFAAYSEYQ